MFGLCAEASAAGPRYGVPCRTSSVADLLITRTSGCCSRAAASRPSGTISAPVRLTSNAESTPWDRHASISMAASRYEQAAKMPQVRCRWLLVTRAITMAYAADTAYRAVIQARGTTVGDGQSNRFNAAPLCGTCLSVSIDMHPPARAILAATQVSCLAGRAGHRMRPGGYWRVIASPH